MQPVLDVKGLETAFITPRGVGYAVDNVDLAVNPGETLGIVGESGCGKTMLALSILGLIDKPGRIVSGQVLYHGRDLVSMDPAELRKLRGKALSMIFQEPMTSLNPVLKVGEQIAEAVRLHRGASQAEALDVAREMLAKVGIPDPARRLDSYPHEMSGGMRQRVVIAMALALDPEVVLADEPTTALDVTIQAEILALMDDLRREFNTAIALITHDLGVVAQVCDRVAVMYSGKIVEQAPVLELFEDPLHPYTRLLLASVPRIGSQGQLAAISGNVPSIFNRPGGCHFHPRCPKAFDRCSQEPPPMYKRDGRLVRCFLYDA